MFVLRFERMLVFFNLPSRFFHDFHVDDVVAAVDTVRSVTAAYDR